MGELVVQTVSTGREGTQSILVLERKLSLGSEPASRGHTETRGRDVEPELGSRVRDSLKPVSARKHFKTQGCGHTSLKIHHKADHPARGGRIRKCSRLYHQ